MKYLLLSTLIMSSCAFKLWDDKTVVRDRAIASLSVQNLVGEEAQSFAAHIDEKLLSLHNYQLIAQKELYHFDEELESKGLGELYEGRAYLSLVAVRTQIDEIEEELKELMLELGHSKKKSDLEKRDLLTQRIGAFAQTSPLHGASLENLSHHLKLKSQGSSFKREDFDLEYRRAQEQREFQIFEKNIEHISHLMEMKLKKKQEKFYPSTLKNGNVTGQEFPAKVWALTFDDGPHQNYSPAIIKNLKEEGLRATFFQLASAVKSDQKTALMVRDAGMEIASHSYSHKPLTLVGELTLQKEIKDATQDIKKSLKVDVKFYRLPYGIGVRTPNIRDKIAEQGLIHVLYNIDSLDWISQNPDKIIKRTKALMKKTAKDSGILLFHDTHERSVIASKAIMEHLKLNGRRTCTLGEIVTQMNEGVETVCPNS